MQALRPLSSSSFAAHHAQHDRLACATPHIFGDAAILQQLKRKRADSQDATLSALETCAPEAKKLREASSTPSSLSQTSSLAGQSSSGTQETMPSTPSLSAEGKSSPRSTTINVSKLDRAKQKIESQINLEILHRHNELRLIDQEIAKVQVALEQIRRCQLVPYPGQHGASVSSYGASTGAGAPLQPSPGFSRPQFPPAFGVADSPYSRHYQQWLLPDGKFDSMPVELMHPPVGGKSYFPEGRSTRAFGERSSFSASRSQRHSHAHQSLPNHYPVAKQQAGPLIIRRLSDQQMVKLVCVWCQKENISSVQGFLNHCRIAHGENFASHEQAAQKCGQPIDSEPASTPTTVNPPPAVLATTPTVATPTVASSPVASVLVHPLVSANRPSGIASATSSALSTPTRSSPLHTSFSQSTSSERPRPKLNIPLGDPKAFVPSQQAPYLSAMMKKMGSGHNLEQLVAMSKTKINLDDVQPLVSPETEDAPNTRNPSDMQASATAVQQHASTAPMSRTTSTAGASAALKGAHVPRPINARIAQPVHTPIATAVSSPRSPNTPGSLGDASLVSGGHDMSPHDLNPGLVSDHDGESSESESEECHATASRRRSSFDVQVRGQSDSLDEQIVAGLAEEHESITCAMQPPSTQADSQHQDDESASEAMAGQKRKRGRPTKAESRQKVKGG